MSKTFLDRDVMREAFRDAAHIAEHGTREEKSGKFLPPPGWTGHLVTAADVASKKARKNKAA
ncbi:MAG: hypothetical protein Q8S03_09450 [Brevundimonas sp.]|uniref:hypothetical protein n=1 Tax=Brevundimonas sp. TaxID=1871086 RepID=UPI0027339FFA|nr:hypothetical protein [Brevundimonas sp.]MDP3404904.1 hypothetical protein [Brevundimonas sp.]